MDNGLFVPVKISGSGGYELVLTLAAASLAVGFSGGGVLAVDGIWQRRRESAAVS